MNIKLKKYFHPVSVESITMCSAGENFEYSFQNSLKKVTCDKRQHLTA